jgi:hypothetical protein
MADGNTILCCANIQLLNRNDALNNPKDLPILAPSNNALDILLQCAGGLPKPDISTLALHWDHYYEGVIAVVYQPIKDTPIQSIGTEEHRVRDTEQNLVRSGEGDVQTNGISVPESQHACPHGNANKIQATGTEAEKEEIGEVRWLTPWGNPLGDFAGFTELSAGKIEDAHERGFVAYTKYCRIFGGCPVHPEARYLACWYELVKPNTVDVLGNNAVISYYGSSASEADENGVLLRPQPFDTSRYIEKPSPAPVQAAMSSSTSLAIAPRLPPKVAARKKHPLESRYRSADTIKNLQAGGDTEQTARCAKEHMKIMPLSKFYLKEDGRPYSTCKRCYDKYKARRQDAKRNTR